MRQTTKAEVCLDEGKSARSGPPRRATRTIGCERGWLRPNFIAVRLDETEHRAQQPRNPGNVGYKFFEIEGMRVGKASPRVAKQRVPPKQLYNYLSRRHRQ